MVSFAFVGNKAVLASDFGGLIGKKAYCFLFFRKQYALLWVGIVYVGRPGGATQVADGWIYSCAIISP